MSYYQRLQNSLGTIGAETGLSAGGKLAELQGQMGLDKSIQQLSSSATREQQQATDKMDLNLGGAGLSAVAGKGISLARGGGTLAGFKIEGARPANVRLAKQTIADSQETMADLGTKGTLRTGESNLRGSLADNIKIRQGGSDIRTGQLLDNNPTSENLGKVDPDKANAFKARNNSRANALSDTDKADVQARVGADPNYNANPTTQTESLQNEFVKQQHIGDVEQTNLNTGTPATPRAGQTTAGDDGTEIKNLGGATQEDVAQRGGLSIGDSALQQGAEKTATEGMNVVAKEGATLLDVGLDAVPIVGEIASLGTMIGEGIHGANVADREQQKQLSGIDQEEQGQLTTEKFGMNRPDFGSMALPSFDVSKNPQTLSE